MSKKKKRLRAAAWIAAGVCIPIAGFYLMEAYTHNPFAEVRPYAQFFNILLFELVAWILVCVSGRVKRALRIELCAAMVYGIANAYVVRFRTNPIVPWDFFSWRTALSVAGGYDFTPDTRMVLVSAAFLALIVSLRYIDRAFFPKGGGAHDTLREDGGTKNFPAREKGIFLLARAVTAAALACVLVAFVGRLQDEEFQTSHRLYPYLFTPAYMTKVNGIAVTFAMDLAYAVVEKPSGYDAEEARETLEGYEETIDYEETGTDELPNIIVVMDEAFSDLAVLGDFDASEDYMPFLHSLQQDAENTVTGYLNVSVCGGNTANTEFEFLTGNTMAFLPQGSVPYQQYVKDSIPALPSYLASLGYQTVAVHPYYASGWDRDTVYPLLGFSESVFLDAFSGADYVRKYVSDDSCVDKIIGIYEEKEAGTPLFLFNVTMQNHGGYTDLYDNFTADVTVDGATGTALSQYLSLVKLSDAALEKLVSYFAGVDEKTVIVFFGDHQPNDTVASSILKLNGKSAGTLTEDETKLRYMVPYVIWANYDIGEASGADTSANYLAAEVLSRAGVPTDSYGSYLLELKEQFPVVSAMRVVAGDGTDADVSAYKEELREYQCIQYYRLFDQNGGN